MGQRGDAGGEARGANGPEARRDRRLLVAVWLVAAVAFSPALLPGAGFAWDDATLIRDNPLMQSAAGLWTMLTGHFWQTAGFANDYYRPLVSLSYWLEAQLFGDWAPGYHWVNVAAHFACVALVYRWLGRRVAPSERAAPHTGVWLALALALFALHPSRAESVAWISGRTDVLALLFALLGFEAHRTAGRLGTVAAALSLVAALLCKETAVMLLVPWVLDPWLRASDEDPAPRQRARWQVGVIAAGAFALRMLLVRGVERPLGDARSFFSAVGLYLREVLAPFPPSAVAAPLPRDATGQVLYPSTWVAVGAVACLVLLALGVLALRRPAARPWLADALWFVCPLFPVLQWVLLQLAGHVAERFLYIPMLGISALVLRAGLAWSRRRAPSRALLVTLTGLLLLLYLPFTLAFARAYRSDPELWAYEMAVDPERVEVLWQALDEMPREALVAQRKLVGELMRVARERNRPDMAMNGALYLLEHEARVLPRTDCQAPLRDLDALAQGKPVRIGPPGGSVELHLPGRQLERMHLEHDVFWAQRAQLLIRCGKAREALEWLSHAPAGGPVSAMRVRATALAEGGDRAVSVLEAALAELPYDRLVTRAGADLERARAAWAEAERDPAAAPVWRARGDMALGDLWSARERLETVAAPLADDPRALAARVELALNAHWADETGAALERARARHPELSSYWDLLSSYDPVAGAPSDFPPVPSPAADSP